MPEQLDLISIAFNHPGVIREQIRLLQAHLLDTYTFTVLDNSMDEDASREIHLLCAAEAVGYLRPDIPRRMHHEALNWSAEWFREKGSDFYGFLDHDVFPSRSTEVIPLLKEAGFYGIGQRCPGNGKLYLWPGLCFFSREWVGDRKLDFGGAAGGDTGSAMWPLFAKEDWKWFYRAEHGYRAIRAPDSVGLQSWGVEFIGDWLHLTNASGWMEIPHPEEREQRVFELLSDL